jgi:hypothetical protein
MKIPPYRYLVRKKLSYPIIEQIIKEWGEDNSAHKVEEIYLP